MPYLQHFILYHAINTLADVPAVANAKFSAPSPKIHCCVGRQTKCLVTVCDRLCKKHSQNIFPAKLRQSQYIELSHMWFHHYTEHCAPVARTCTVVFLRNVLVQTFHKSIAPTQFNTDVGRLGLGRREGGMESWWAGEGGVRLGTLVQILIPLPARLALHWAVWICISRFTCTDPGSWDILKVRK